MHLGSLKSFLVQGSLNVIVQTSESQSNLPASAIQVEGATVNSVTPVSGSDGRLFNVGLTTNSGASTVAVSTIAGITLASGLTSLASNRLQINLATPNPQVSSKLGPVHCKCDTLALRLQKVL